MIDFNLDSFLAPLTPAVFLTVVITGAFLGWMMRRAKARMSVAGVYWAIVGGFIFYLPVALIRAYEGSQVYERLIATLPLWVLFLLVMQFVGTFRRGDR